MNMPRTVIIAIDPGKTGGVAVLYPNQKIVLHAMPPTESDVVALLREIQAAANVEGHLLELHIEKVSGFAGKGQPGSSMFVFGRGVGVIVGVAIAFGIPFFEVTPQTWMRALGLGTKGKRTKIQWKWHLIDQARKRHPALAGINAKSSDALLLLDYATSNRSTLILTE